MVKEKGQELGVMGIRWVSCRGWQEDVPATAPPPGGVPGLKRTRTPMSGGPQLMTLQLNPKRRRRRVRYLA